MAAVESSTQLPTSALESAMSVLDLDADTARETKEPEKKKNSKCLVRLVIFSGFSCFGMLIFTAFILFHPTFYDDHFRLTPAEKTVDTPVSTSIPTIESSSVDRVCKTPGCVLIAASLIDSIDESISACDNFYRYACGKRIDKRELTGELSDFSRAGKQIPLQMKKLLEVRDEEGEQFMYTSARKFYRTCLDARLRNEENNRVFLQLLKSITKWPLLNSGDITNLDITGILIKMAQLNVDIFFSLEIHLNPSTHGQFALMISPMDTYLPDQIKSQQDIDKFYKNLKIFVIKTIKLLEDDDPQMKISQSDLEKLTDDVINIDRQLVSEYSKIEWTGEPSAGSDYTIRNMFTKKIDWTRLIDKVVRDPFDYASSRGMMFKDYPRIVVMNDVVNRTDEKVLVNYMFFKMVSSFVPFMDKRFRQLEENLQSYISSHKPQKSNWESCLELTKSYFKNTLDHMFVTKYYKRLNKEAALNMSDYLRKSVHKLVNNLDWMDEKTKKMAHRKVDRMFHLMAYACVPDQWLKPESSHILNFLNLTSFMEMGIVREKALHEHKFRRLVDDVDSFDEFDVDILRLDARYFLVGNELEIPAALLQRPYFDSDFPNQVNYGLMGTLVSQHMMMGFDDKGGDYDDWGNARTWWSNDTKQAFNKKVSCLFQDVTGDAHTRRQLLAQFVARKISFTAYGIYENEKGPEKLLPGLDVTNNQAFFISSVQNYCDNNNNNEKLINKQLSHLNYFAETFNCRSGDAMVAEKTCEIW